MHFFLCLHMTFLQPLVIFNGICVIYLGGQLLNSPSIITTGICKIFEASYAFSLIMGMVRSAAHMNLIEVPFLCRGGILPFIFSDKQSLMLASLMLLLVLAESKGQYVSAFAWYVDTASPCTAHYFFVPMFACLQTSIIGSLD